LAEKADFVTQRQISTCEIIRDSVAGCTKLEDVGHRDRTLVRATERATLKRVRGFLKRNAEPCGLDNTDLTSG